MMTNSNLRKKLLPVTILFVITILGCNSNSEQDSRNTNCDNPGGSVPSPYDSCNTCSCTQSGKIGFCTEVGCIDGGNQPSCYDECLGSGNGPRQCSHQCSPEEVLEPPYNQLTYCNEDGDNGEAFCKEQTDDEFTFCH